MKRLPWILGVVLALVAGLAIGYVTGTASEARPKAPPAGGESKARATSPAPDLAARAKELEKRVADLEADVARKTKEAEDAKTALAAAQALPTAEPAAPAITPEEQKKGLEVAEKSIGVLSKKGLFAFYSPENKELLAEIKKGLHAAGDLAYQFLAEMIEGTDSTKRFLALVLLGDLDPEKAFPIYLKSLESEDDLVRRTASQALAIKQAEKAFPHLMKAMKEDKDWGVRANSAYGVAKMGEKSGVPVLVECYNDKSRQPVERMGVLWGIADIADPSTAPLFRDILSTSKDDSSLIIAITAVEKMKDQASLAALQAIIQGKASSMVKDPAKKAYNTICGQEVYR